MRFQKESSSKSGYMLRIETTIYLEIHLESVPSGGTTCFQYFAVKKQHFTLIAYVQSGPGWHKISFSLSQQYAYNIVACNRAVMNNKNYCGKRHMTFPQELTNNAHGTARLRENLLRIQGIVLKYVSKCTVFTSKVTHIYVFF